VEILFEQFEVPALFVSKSSVLASFSQGRATSLVVESGAGHTTVSVVHDGYLMNKSVRRTKIAGQLLDQMLENYVTHKKQKEIVPLFMLKREDDKSNNSFKYTKLSGLQTTESFYRLHVHEIIRDIKETVTKLSDSAFDITVPLPNVDYDLPDGQKILLSNERFLLPEFLFNPECIRQLDLKNTASAFSSSSSSSSSASSSSSSSSSSPYNLSYSSFTSPASSQFNDFENTPFTGLHQMLLDSVEKVDVDLQKDLYSNIVLSGGNTMFTGMPNRLTKELGQKLPPVSVNER
jgi:actin-like protein 6A